MEIFAGRLGWNRLVMLDLIDILVASCFATIVVCVLMVMVHVAERESRVCWWTLLVLLDPAPTTLTPQHPPIQSILCNNRKRDEDCDGDDAPLCLWHQGWCRCWWRRRCAGLFAGLQIVIRGIGHRSIKSNVSTANKPTPMERTCLKLHIGFPPIAVKKCTPEEEQVEMKVLKVKWWSVCVLPCATIKANVITTSSTPSICTM